MAMDGEDRVIDSQTFNIMCVPLLILNIYIMPSNATTHSVNNWLCFSTYWSKNIKQQHNLWSSFTL